MFIISHFVGCGFHYAAKYDVELGRNDTWLDKANIL